VPPFAAKLPEQIRKQVDKQMGEEVLAKGATWAEANAVRCFVAAVAGKNGTFDSKEIREAIEGKARQRFEVAGVHGEEIKASVKTKLSTNDLLGAIYGLTEPAGRLSAAVPVPTDVGVELSKKKDSGQK
jgi:hypothetical protein